MVAIDCTLVALLIDMFLPGFDCLRVWVICEFEWIPLIIVFILSMFIPAINIVSLYMMTGS